MTLEVVIVCAIVGGLGGISRALITGKGVIALPKRYDIPGCSPHLNLGVIAPIILGAFAGILARQSLGVNGIISAIAGYAGADFIENVLERTFKK